MKTGSLRTRVSLITLTLLTVVLSVVVAAVTLAYRSKLDGDLHRRLAAAGTAVEHAGSGAAAKPLVQGLALEGIATSIESAVRPLPAGKRGLVSPPLKTGSFIRTRGSLLVLSEMLPDKTEVTFSASRGSVDRAVMSLLRVELLVAACALALATLLVLRVTRTALRPLSQVVETATRITAGDSKRRLEPSRTDTELGSMAAAFDRMVDALEAAVEDARASEAATRRFLADASHELRTPIAAVQARVETLLREQPQRPHRDRLEAALAREVARLGRLVDDLLSLARLEARPRREPITLAALATTAVEEASTRAPRAQLTVTADKDASVEGDPDALARVLRNLLDNSLAAIPPEGSVHVQVERRDGHVEAQVCDNGPGVPEAERERIFERFVRLDASRPGSGLGLAIARRIARQHGGDLTCNAKEQGASFTLTLPTAALPAGQPRIRKTTTATR
jgi:signal transduction histidine kinase